MTSGKVSILRVYRHTTRFRKICFSKVFPRTKLYENYVFSERMGVIFIIDNREFFKDICIINFKYTVFVFLSIFQKRASKARAPPRGGQARSFNKNNLSFFEPRRDFGNLDFFEAIFRWITFYNVPRCCETDRTCEDNHFLMRNHHIFWFLELKTWKKGKK